MAGQHSWAVQAQVQEIRSGCTRCLDSRPNKKRACRDAVRMDSRPAGHTAQDLQETGQ